MDWDFNIVNPESDSRYRDYWGSYHESIAHRDITLDLAMAVMRTNTTTIAEVIVHRSETDSLICGAFNE